MTDAPAESASVLARVDRCYDDIPRAAAQIEEIGPFTLFVARPGTGWSLYARPRLGATDLTPDDVRRVLARQRELHLPQAIEWVAEVTPGLTAAVRTACPDAHLQTVPLLAAAAARVAAPTEGRTRVLAADDPDLGLVSGIVSAGFAGRDVAEPAPAERRRVLIERGDLVVVAGYDDGGRLVAGGSAAPRGTAAELMGIATLPSARGRGVAGEVTRALTAAVAARGVDLAFLTAASEAAAGVYRRAGFTRAGTGMILAAG